MEDTTAAIRCTVGRTAGHIVGNASFSNLDVGFCHGDCWRRDQTDGFRPVHHRMEAIAGGHPAAQ